MNDLWNQIIGSETLTFAINVLLQSTLLSALLLLISLVSRRWLTVRHSMLFFGLVALLSMPLIACGLANHGVTIVELEWFSDQSQTLTSPNGTQPAAVDSSHAAVLPEDTPINSAQPDRPMVETIIPAPQMSEAVITSAASEPVRSSSTWNRGQLVQGFIAFWLIGTGLALFGLVRSFIGLRRVSQQSVLANDEKTARIVSEICKDLGIQRAPEIYDSPQVPGPVVVGCFRPRVILPARIRTHLSEDELRDVLTHEMAHVRRRDPVVVLLQGIASSMYWMNPFVHMLNRYLARTREEICDNYVLDRAGPLEYGKTLLHVGQLLPQRGRLANSVGLLNAEWKLEDRIAGLLDERRDAMFHIHPLKTLSIATLVGVIAIGTASRQLAFAQKRDTAGDTESTTDAAATTGLEYVPADAAGIISLRPKSLFSQPGLVETGKLFGEDVSFTSTFGMPLIEIERVVVVGYPAFKKDEQDAVGVIARSKSFDKKKILSGIAQGATEKKTENGETYYSIGGGGINFAYIPNDTTLVFALTEPVIKQMIAAGQKGAAGAAWTKNWKQFSSKHLAVAGNMERVNQFLDKALLGAPEPMINTFGPLWKHGVDVSIGLHVSGKVDLKGVYNCKNEQAAPKVEETLNATLALARTALAFQKNQIQKQKRVSPELLVFDLAGKLMSGLKVKREGKTVTVTTTLDADTSQRAIASTAEAINAARSSAQRAQSANNMKQLGIAFHNYHAAHGHLPAPAVVGPDGKTLHSWRVALLPYLDQQQLYDMYKLDEPWDSPNNKKVLAMIPPVFRHPDVKEGTNTSYAAMVGKDTAFYGKKGATFADIRDGLTNTIFVVETRKIIPWTKPEDIQYDATKPIPKMGGYTDGVFFATFGDGSVRAVSHDIGEKLIRAYLTIDGGEVIENQ